MGLEPVSESVLLVVIDDEARVYGIKIAYATYAGGTVADYPPNWDNIVGEVLRELEKKYSLESLKNDPIVRAYRKFYWRIGIDPTKTRPSSEALVRRALRGKWPRINPIVDAGNLASALYMIPIGLYDMDYFEPPARITLSRGGEVFEPIGGKREELPEGVPIMINSRGIVMHLYPHRDSRITMVRPATTKLLAVAAGVPGVPEERLVAVLEELTLLLALLGWERTSEIRVVS